VAQVSNLRSEDFKHQISGAHKLNYITILYDSSCGFCSRCREWIEAQEKYFPIEFVAADSADALQRFPGYATEAQSAPGELVVIADDGGVYCGSNAFIMCMYALPHYRDLAIHLSSPSLMPLAAKAFKALSSNRRNLSQLLHLKSDAELDNEETVCEVGCKY
jgi:predicted DCC family thiol-disulfide oxidoreductase YuxK